MPPIGDRGGSPEMIDSVLERLSRLHPKIIDLSLTRVHTLLDRLNHPERRLPPVIHVAGTNGKGSTIAAMRAVLEAAGKVVHVYTSPHLVRFAERVRIAGQIPSDEAMIGLLEEVEAVNGSEPITFFEITTVAALLAFARFPADVLLLETGLGGRLDATNVVDRPAATVITPIGLDHQQFLGDTITAIAGEKAGIIKPGVPCFMAAQDRDVMRVLADRATEMNAPMIVEGRDFKVERDEDGQMAVTGLRSHMVLPPPNLPGEFQLHNAALALAVLDYLFPDLPIDAIAHGMEHIHWPARLQRLRQGPLVDLLPQGWELWLDGGHNPHGAAAIAQFLSGWSDAPILAVMAMLTTKDAAGVLSHLAPRFYDLRAVTVLGEHNSMAAADLAAHAHAHGLQGAVASADVEAALRDLVAQGHAKARVLICGSLYLAGMILERNG